MSPRARRRRAPGETARGDLGSVERVHVIDSHTEGEPTRVVTDGGPELGAGPLAEQLRRFRMEHDRLRSTVVGEPRGLTAAVGALLRPPQRGGTCGVIFFNNTGYLGMCGHGSIGLAVTLAYLHRIEAPGTYRFDTPVGRVRATLHSPHEATIDNVPSYRYRHEVLVEVPGYGPIVGDVAYGGNWFFLVDDSPVDLRMDRRRELVDYTTAVRAALHAQGVTGRAGAEIDHIELSGPAVRTDADGRNFVLCPGGEYDRSPCGTGTSAKMACLFAEGRLKPGMPWRQESLLGTLFEGRFRAHGAQILPSIRGTAYVTGEADLIVDPEDPLAFREDL